MIIGLLHGLTNLGGGLLTVFVSTFYRDKKQIRGHIASFYLILNILQLVILMVLRQFVWNEQIFLLIILALPTYIFIGNRVFHFMKDQYFHHIMTVFIYLIGIMVFLT